MGTLHTGLVVDVPTQQALLTSTTWGAMPTGVLAETCSRRQPLSALTIVTANTTFAAIPLAKGTVVSNLTFWAIGAAGTPTHQLAGLYDSTFQTILATSADGTSGAWGANSAKTFAMTSPYTVTTEGLYYVALATVATTPPTIAGVAAGIAAQNLAAPPIAFTDTAHTISTALVAATASAGFGMMYCAVS